MKESGGPDFTLKLTYVPPVDQYNGVLILLKEPNDPNERNEKDSLIQNSEWFLDVIDGKPSRGNYTDKTGGRLSISKYGNRFREMLQFIDKNNDLDLTGIVYGNISIYGGNSKTGKRYQDAEKLPRLKTILEGLSEKGYKTQYAFICKDLFYLLSEEKDAKLYPNKGLIYKNRKTGLICQRNIRFYEIIHPARCPRIITKID